MKHKKTSARMFTNLFHGLVVDAKLQKKYSWNATSFYKNARNSISLLGSKCKLIKNKIPKTQEAFTRILTNLSMIW